MKIPAISRSGRGRPGEPVRMAIRALATGVTAKLVQLTTGPGAADQCRVGTEPVVELSAMRATCHLQDCSVGSCAQRPLGNLIPREGVTVRCFIRPMFPAHGVQTHLDDQPCIGPRRTPAVPRAASVADQWRAGIIDHAGCSAPRVFGGRRCWRPGIPTRSHVAAVSPGEAS